MRPRLALVAAAAAATIPLTSIALAADPESGTVAPGGKVSWTGEVTATYAVWLQWFQNAGEGECSDPACDSFALEVTGGPANVTVKMKASSPDPSQEAIRVVKPDGSIAYFNNTEAGDAETKLVLKNAPNGKYSVDIATGSKTRATYEASAEMAGGSAPPSESSSGTSPSPPPPPPPSTTPVPSPGTAQPGTGEDFTLEVTAPKVKARKARKGAKIKVGVKVSREVQSVTAILKKGKKKVGAGKLGRLNGAGTVVVKLSKKLKKGRYAVTVSARDAGGVVVTRTVAVKVSK
jgi:methionine-rich copper-binding protein CopC